MVNRKKPEGSNPQDQLPFTQCVAAHRKKKEKEEKKKSLRSSKVKRIKKKVCKTPTGKKRSRLLSMGLSISRDH